MIVRSKLVKKVIFLIIILVVISDLAAKFTTKGKDFIDRKTGERVILRGFGIGCWLLPEGYMWGIGKYDRPWQFEKAIEELIGEEDARKFWEIYHRNFFTEEDVKAMKMWGVNSIRIALLASWLQPRDSQPDKPPFIYSEYGVSLLDSVVKWCERHDVGLIWDMHGAPGAQNAENISDSDGEARLWSEKEKYWPRLIDLWYKIAERYKDSDVIIGYDLLNEPLLIRYGYDPKLLRELYLVLTDTIRRVDSLGIIFIEGDDWAQNFDMLEPIDWDPHIAIAFHSYPPTSDEKGLARWEKLREKYNIPLWHGETGEQGPPYDLNRKATKFLESRNVSWSWWTHKKFDNVTQPWSVIRIHGFLKILDYWNGNADRPGRREARKFLFLQAELTNSKYCQFYPDMVSSLNGLDVKKYLESRSIEEPKIYVQPVNLKVEEGGAFQNAVIATGYPLNYKWYVNKKSLPGQNKANIVISNVTRENNGDKYYVVVYNSKGYDISKEFILKVTPFKGVNIRRATSSIVIDGKLDDDWKRVDELTFENLIYQEKWDKQDILAKVRLLWDNKGLYLFINVQDNVLINNRDGIEVYIDSDNNRADGYTKHDCFFKIYLNGDFRLIRGANINPEFKIENSKNGYIIELAMFWEDLSINMSGNNFIGLDIHVMDADNEYSKKKLTLFNKTDSAYRSTFKLGTVKIVE